MSTFRLSPQQHTFVETFGFLVLPGLLQDRIAEIIAAFEALWSNHGGGHGGKPHDGTARSCLVPFIDQSETLSALLDDDRVNGVFASLLGDDFQYLGSDGNFYVGDTGWHSDGPWPRPIRYYKMALYLDPVRRDSGALRIVPGSHRYGDSYAEALQKQIWKPKDNWSTEGRDVPCAALESNPGDVVIFNQGCKHASYGGSKRRRMFTMNCTSHHTPEQLPLIREEISGFARFQVDHAYGEAMLRTATPARLRHLEQAIAQDGHLAALSAEHRRQHPESARG